jgi:hypothetical protein
MKKVWVLLLLVLTTGCVTLEEKGYSYNLQQATARSTGDLAMTALLDEGVNQAEAVSFCNAVIKFVEDGAITKSLLREGVANLLATKFNRPEYVNYSDSIFLFIPSQIDANQKIPADIRKAILSFLKDGALHGAALYDPSRPPKDDEEAP